MSLTKDEALGILVASLPYPNHIDEVDVSSEPDAIRFTWRRDRFRWCLRNMVVEHLERGMCIGDNLSILVGELLKMETLRRAVKAEREAHG